MDWGVFRAVHPFPSVLVAGLTVALVPLMAEGAPSALAVRLGVVMLFFQFAIGLTNDIVDVEDDREAKPWKPIPRGVLPRGVAVGLAVGFALAGLALSLALPVAAFLVGALGLGSGLVYDLWLKRTPLSWLPYSVALPLLPAWVALAADEWRPALWWAFPLGAALGLALHLANEAPDVDRDGVRGLPGRLGPRTSRWLAVGLFGVVGLGIAAVLGVRSPGAAVAAGVLTALVVGVTPFARVLGRDGLFGLLAVGGAALAAVFLTAV